MYASVCPPRRIGTHRRGSIPSRSSPLMRMTSSADAIWAIVKSRTAFVGARIRIVSRRAPSIAPHCGL